MYVIKRMVNSIVLTAGIICAGIVSAAFGQGDLFIKNATIITGTGETIENGSILVRQGTIDRMGPGISAPDGVWEIDAEGMFAMPGIIDHHSHIAGEGLNEATSQNSAMVDVSE